MAITLFVSVVFVFTLASSGVLLTRLIVSDAMTPRLRPPKRGAVVVGGSPYRATRVEAPYEAAPIWLRVTCWVDAMGGLVTLMLFAPAALFGSFDLAFDDYGSGARPAFMFFMSISGFVAGVVHIHVARRTLRHEHVGDSAFMFLYAHHACVAGVLALVGALSLPAVVVCSALCVAVIAMDVATPSPARVQPQRMS